MMVSVPFTLDMYVQLPILIVLISIVYAATRYDEWTSIFTEAFRWGSRMFLFLASIAFVLYLISEFGMIVVWIGIVLAGISLVFYLLALVIAPFVSKGVKKAD